MNRSSELNPAPWRDEDVRHRMAVPRRPASDLASVLRQSFVTAPLPEDMARLLERLR